MPGTSVSLAPRNAPPATILAANNGSASSSILNTEAPSCCTSGSGVRKANTYGHAKNMIVPVKPMMTIPENVVSHAKDRARSFRFAPIACPTIVVAAEDIPNPGI